MSARLEPGYFERLYERDGDPWSFATSPYERDKYEQTLAALEGRRFATALEAGCSIGVFTEMLAPSCDELLGVDASERALAAARERVAGQAHVRLQRRVLPEELPAGPFDLVVCSELLYYWDEELLLAALGSLEAAVAPGGSLLAVHWRPRTETYPLQGDDVHRLLREHTTLVPALERVEPRYRLDRFDRPAR